MRLRRRLKIQALDRISKRRNVFMKRCSDLINRTKRLSRTGDEKAGIIVISKGGKAYGFGHPAVGDILDRRYPPIPGGSAADQLSPEAERRLREALAADDPDWDAVTKDMRLRDLVQMQAALMRLQRLVQMRERELGGAEEEEDGDPTSVLNL